jgi:hypothetical protein
VIISDSVFPEEAPHLAGLATQQTNEGFGDEKH